jgi:signal transduction histidine kinase
MTTRRTDASAGEAAHAEAELGEAALSIESGGNEKRFSMLEQAEHSERSASSGYPPCRQWTPPPRKPLPSLKTLVARMSHDLRTPLAAILANAEFLTESTLSKEERDEFYQEIRFSIDRMEDLVSDLLECSKGGEVLRPGIGNIVETTERAMRMIQVRPAFRQIAITHRHEGSTIGWYNAKLLERAVSNVVLNACEAVSPESGRVVITTLGGPSCLLIEVWDNGPGIPAEMKDSVFRPFFTLGKSEGTGLGLAIAKRIVEDHGGDLFLDAAEKSGTSFKMSIPFGIPEGGIT